MAELNPCGWLQNAGATHTAEGERLVLTSLLGRGATATGALRSKGGVSPFMGSLLKVQQTATPSMAVEILSGLAFVAGTLGTRQGSYACTNDATVTLSIDASDATLNRIDTVIAEVQDSQYAGAVNAWRLRVVKGTPASTPAPPDISSLIALPLADVAVNAGVTSIVTANITDRRVYMVAAGGNLPVYSIAERNALVPFPGMVILRMDGPRTPWAEVYDDAVWKIQGVPTLDVEADLTTFITNPQDGDLAVVGSTDQLYQRDLSVWKKYPEILAHTPVQVEQEVDVATSSTTYVDLGANDMDITMPYPPSGKVMFYVMASLQPSVADTGDSFMSIEVRDTNAAGVLRLAANDRNGVRSDIENREPYISGMFLVTGLPTSGTMFVRAKYRVNAGTCDYFFRRIIADPRP